MDSVPAGEPRGVPRDPGARADVRGDDLLRDRRDVLYLWWYTLQGEDGAELSDSTHWLDERHAAYWRECIDPDEPSLLLIPEVHMSPERLEDAMRPLGE